MSMSHSAPDCELCQQPGGTLLWRNGLCRVVLVADPLYPGFCRVILNRHVAEMTDLPAPEQHALMSVVFAVEACLRQLLQPTKINLASFGNMVPHVHWHVIPRFADDTHFPQPVWGTAQRQGAAHGAPAVEALRRALVTLLGPDAGEAP